MRYDLLDEYSTLVPFGLGVAESNRVVGRQTCPDPARSDAAPAESAGKRKLTETLARLGRSLGHPAQLWIWKRG